jgi:RNAse (barnase) inhibitor barstar
MEQIERAIRGGKAPGLYVLNTPASFGSPQMLSALRAEAARQGVLLLVDGDVPLLTREDLFDRLVQIGSFPHYFGRNWDALADMLMDLSWLSPRPRVMVVGDLEALAAHDPQAYETFLQIGQEAVDLWSDSPTPLSLFIYRSGAAQ